MSTACILLVYLISLFILRPEYRRVFGQDILGGAGGDAGLYIWLTRRILQKGLIASAFSFDVGFFYPAANNLAFSDSFLLPAAIVKGLLALGISFSSAYNCLLVAVQVLNGYCAYRLTLYLWGSPGGAFTAGAAFLHLPFLGAHIMHHQLQFAFFIPMTLHITLLLWKGGRIISAFSLGLLCCAAFLCSVYYAIFALFLAAVASLGCLLSRSCRFSRRALIAVVAGLVPGAALLFCLAQPYIVVRNELSGWSIYDLKYFAAPLSAYFSAPASAWLWGKSTSHLAHPEAQLFPGIMVYLLAWAGFVLGQRKPKGSPQPRPAIFVVPALVVPAAASAIAWSISAGPAMIKAAAVAGFFWTTIAVLLLSISRSQRGQENTVSSTTTLNFQVVVLVAVVFVFGSLGILVAPHEGGFDPGLGGLLYRFVPGFEGLRAQSRLGVPALLAVCCLAGLGSSTIVARLRSRIRQFGALALMISLIGAESRLTSFPFEHLPQPPPLITRFNSISGREAVIVLPFNKLHSEEEGFARQQVHFMQLLLPSGRPLVNGFSGKIPHSIDDLIGKTGGFPDTLSINSLSAIPGLSYVIYDASSMTPKRRREFETKIANLPARLVLVDRDNIGLFVMRLVR